VWYYFKTVAKKIAKRASKTRISRIIIYILTLGALCFALMFINTNALSKADQELNVLKERFTQIKTTPTPYVSPTPYIASNNAVPRDDGPWGIAKQLSEHTWTMKVGEDTKMATAKEVFDALNHYRIQKGSSNLTWDDKLADFALKRAQTFVSIGKLDGHAGFESYFKDEQHLKDIGFWGVGENSSYGFKMEGVHLIEWVFAGDKPHDDNQLDSSWTHVGIGVSETGVDLVFGKDKM
jgi:uncharacterized protein YkwD